MIPGSSHVQRHSEDTGLVLTIAERLRSGEDEPRLVIADEERQMAKHHEMKAEYEFVTASLPGDALVDRLRPSDLVVVPSHLLLEMPSRAVSGFRTDWPTKTSRSLPDRAGSQSLRGRSPMPWNGSWGPLAEGSLGIPVMMRAPLRKVR